MAATARRPAVETIRIWVLAIWFPLTRPRRGLATERPGQSRCVRHLLGQLRIQPIEADRMALVPVRCDPIWLRQPNRLSWRPAGQSSKIRRLTSRPAGATLLMITAGVWSPPAKRIFDPGSFREDPVSIEDVPVGAMPDFLPFGPTGIIVPVKCAGASTVMFTNPARPASVVTLQGLRESGGHVFEPIHANASSSRLRVGIIKTLNKSASCDAPGHEPDVCDEEPCDGAFESVLPIFGEAA